MNYARRQSCVSLVKIRWLPAIHCSTRNIAGKHHEPKQGLFHTKLLKGAEHGSHVYVSSDFQNHFGMQLVFLGTSSSVPTPTRNTSCLAVRLEGTVYLFDCGEGAQKQFLQTPFRQRGVDKIFITHMHGDHIFGLPALMAGISVTASAEKKAIEIYGPQGLRNWLRVTLNASYARVPTKYSVHELILKKSKSAKPSTKPQRNEMQHEDELPGRDIYSSRDGLWHVFSDDRYKVQAGLLKHSIPCWGYVLEEHTRIGRFMVERAEQIGVESGEKRALLQQGQSVFVNGKKVNPSDVLGPPRRGRKRELEGDHKLKNDKDIIITVILGDTYDSQSLQSVAFGADILVHECTLLEEDADQAVEKAHSTATMAGKFARLINAHSVILTHFGGKFNARAGRLVNSVKCAKKAFGKDTVVAASDLLAVTVRQTDDVVEQV